MRREPVHENNIQLSRICEAIGPVAADSEVQAIIVRGCLAFCHDHAAG